MYRIVVVFHVLLYEYEQKKKKQNSTYNAHSIVDTLLVVHYSFICSKTELKEMCLSHGCITDALYQGLNGNKRSVCFTRSHLHNLR